jgi:hypothetical protein
MSLNGKRGSGAHIRIDIEGGAYLLAAAPHASDAKSGRWVR